MATFYSEFDPILADAGREQTRQEVLAATGATEVAIENGKITSARLIGAQGDYLAAVLQQQAQGKVLTGALPVATPAAALPTLGSIAASLPAAAQVGLGAAAVGGAVYGGLQALGLGEGGGILGVNVLGGDVSTIPGSNVQLGGPGLPEPSAAVVVKQWVANGSQFYLLNDGRIAVYSKRRGRWKVYRPARLAVIGKNMPSHRMLTRLRRYMKKQAADAKTVLQIASPTTYAKQLGYRKPRRRH